MFARIFQGDPKSPYLFVIAIKVLTAWIYKNRRVSISLESKHLIFADDVFLFSRGDMIPIVAVLEGVTAFTKWSGLEPNCNKSHCLFGNVSEQVIVFVIVITNELDSCLLIAHIPRKLKMKPRLGWKQFEKAS